MTLTEFKSTLLQGDPPLELSQHLLALWHAARDEWDQAHRLVQDLDDAHAAWIHAYLHREEGDNANAGYWYRRAGRPASTVSLKTEWDEIAKSLLDQAS